MMATSGVLWKVFDKMTIRIVNDSLATPEGKNAYLGECTLWRGNTIDVVGDPEKFLGRVRAVSSPNKIPVAEDTPPGDVYFSEYYESGYPPEDYDVTGNYQTCLYRYIVPAFGEDFSETFDVDPALQWEENQGDVILYFFGAPGINSELGSVSPQIIFTFSSDDGHPSTEQSFVFTYEGAATVEFTIVFQTYPITFFYGAKGLLFDTVSRRISVINNQVRGAYTYEAVGSSVGTAVVNAEGA